MIESSQTVWRLGVFSILWLLFTANAHALPNTHLAPDQSWVVSKDYTEVRAFIGELAAQYPKNAQLFTLGLSDSGVPIEGLKIGNGPVNNMVVSTHHGNEYGATEVAKGVAKDLVASPIAGQTVWLIPVLNIPGYNTRNRGETVAGSYHDPNRDYPGPCGSDSVHALKSTAALAHFVDAQQIVTSATLHTFSPAVVYPWGLASQDLSTPYDAEFTRLAQAATQESHYQVGNSTQVIYAANGTYEDYAFWKHGIWSLLFELGTTHYPADTAVEEMIRVNVPGIRRFLETAPKTRAVDHAFKGKCDDNLRRFDRRDE